MTPTATPPLVWLIQREEHSFQRTDYCQEVIVVLNRKALEPPLIHVPLTGSVVMGVIAHRVSRRDPPQKIAHRPIPVGPQNQMPMIGIN
jgi:hypothetical protein